MLNKIAQNVFLLVVFTLGLFFIMYTFFKNNSYYENTVKINSFVLPVICATFVFYMNYNLLKQGNYSLRKGFLISFSSLLISGVVSHGFIFYFLRFIDLDTGLLIRTQWINAFKENTKLSNPENLKQILNDLDSAQKKGASILSNKYLLMFAGMQTIFYLFLSFFVSFFIRSRA